MNTTCILYIIYNTPHTHTHTHIETPGCRRPGIKAWRTAQHPLSPFPEKHTSFALRNHWFPRCTQPISSSLTKHRSWAGQLRRRKSCGVTNTFSQLWSPSCCRTHRDLASRSFPSPAPASPLVLWRPTAFTVILPWLRAARMHSCCPPLENLPP